MLKWLNYPRPSKRTNFSTQLMVVIIHYGRVQIWNIGSFFKRSSRRRRSIKARATGDAHQDRDWIWLTAKMLAVFDRTVAKGPTGPAVACGWGRWPFDGSLRGRAEGHGLDVRKAGPSSSKVWEIKIETFHRHISSSSYSSSSSSSSLLIFWSICCGLFVPFFKIRWRNLQFDGKLD